MAGINNGILGGISGNIGEVEGFVRFGVPHVRGKKRKRTSPQTPNNTAKSYQLLNAVQGEYPDISINYPAVRLTQGKIELPLNPQITVEDNGVRFSWTYDITLNWCDRQARAMVLIHVETTSSTATDV